GRIDDAGNVPARRQGVANLAEHMLGGQIRSLPGGDVVVLGSEHVHWLLYFPEIDRGAGDPKRTWANQQVVDVAGSQVLRVHRRRHVRAVPIPGKEVKRRRRLAHVPVVDDVIPDQVVTTQPVERLRHRGRL